MPHTPASALRADRPPKSMGAAVLFPTPAHAEAISTVGYLLVMSNCCFLLWVPTA